MSFVLPTKPVTEHGFDPENFKVLSGPYATWQEAEVARKEQFEDTPNAQPLWGTDMKYYVVQRITK